MLARHWNLVGAAAENVARNARGYAVAAAALVAALTPCLCGIAISEGLESEALASVAAGADVVCGWSAFGRPAPLATERLAELESLEGVERAVPRIVGQVRLGDELPVVIGVPFEVLRARAIEVEGALPESEADVLVGHELARVLELAPGATIALEGDTLRLFRVAGIVSATSSLLSAKAIVCDLPEAQEVFGDRGHVTDACLYTRAGYEALVAEAVARLDPRYRVQTRGLVSAYVERGMTLREGAFTVLFALALALAIPAFAVMSYMGAAPRRREIGLYKAEGWSTADVLEMVAIENLLVSLLAAGLALFLSLVWLRALNAPLIAAYFLPDLPLFPEISIPARFLPLPALLALVFSLTVTMTGSIYSTWRTAVTRPTDVLR